MPFSCEEYRNVHLTSEHHMENWTFTVREAMALHSLTAELLCPAPKVPVLGADTRKNPSLCQPGKNTPKIEQRETNKPNKQP